MINLGSILVHYIKISDKILGTSDYFIWLRENMTSVRCFSKNAAKFKLYQSSKKFTELGRRLGPAQGPLTTPVSIKSGLDWLQTANFGHSAGFSIFSPKMRLRLTRNGQFHLIHNFSHQSVSFLEKSQKFSFLWGGYIGIFFEFFNFFESFHTEVDQNDTQWQILPKKVA